MNEQYYERLREYRKLVKHQGYSWVLVFIVAIATLFTSEHIVKITIYNLSGLLPIFISGGILANLRWRIMNFKCPRCCKPFITKYKVFGHFQSTSCVHCGLSINILPELSKPTTKNTGEEWFK